MNKTKNIIGIVVILVIIAGAIYFAIKSPAAPEANLAGLSSAGLEQINPEGGGTTTQVGSSYSLVDVATHGNATSCWSVINGNVYDLTTWIGQHPGGEGAILSICGKDGTSAFMGQHGDNGKANRTLATFKIGMLKN